MNTAWPTWGFVHEEKIRVNDYYAGDVSLLIESTVPSEWRGTASPDWCYEQFVLEWQSWGGYGGSRVTFSRDEAMALMAALARATAMLQAEEPTQ